MKLILPLFLIFIKVGIVFGCCSAGQYKIYPLGYQNNKLIVTEFKMSRRCLNGDGAGKDNEFHWNVIVNLSYINADTNVIIKNIDSLAFKDCTCDFRNVNEKSKLSEKLLPAYNRALKTAKGLKEFKELVPESYSSITKLDSLHDYKFIDTDTTSELYYKGKLKHLNPINWGYCGFLNNVQEIRKYRLEEKQIVIVNLSCSPIGALPDEKLLSNKKNFKLLETAVIYTPTQWHGLSMDYLLEY